MCVCRSSLLSHCAARHFGEYGLRRCLPQHALLTVCAMRISLVDYCYLAFEGVSRHILERMRWSEALKRDWRSQLGVPHPASPSPPLVHWVHVRSRSTSVCVSCHTAVFKVSRAVYDSFEWTRTDDQLVQSHQVTDTAGSSAPVH